MERLASTFIGIMLWLDSIIYSFVGYVYEIFGALSGVNVFKSADYQDIVNRIYVVLGLIMMFVLAYSLLRAVINPDEFSKGENSVPKIIKNVIVSLAIIAFLPTAFTVAFNFQNSVLNNHTIPNLVFGYNSSSNGYNDSNKGNEIAYYVFSAFLHPDEEWCIGVTADTSGGDTHDINRSDCAEMIEGSLGNNFKDVSQEIVDGDSSIGAYKWFGKAVGDDKLEYSAFLSTIAGGFLLWVMVSFCFDVGIRVVKLVFFQIIAPIPVVCRVIPGGKLKGVFGDWMKKTISTYIDVFIRIFIMSFAVYLISLINNYFSDSNFSLGLGTFQTLFAKVFLIMGVVAFMRQAPKLICDMFHLDSGGMSLGIKDKLAAGGAFAAGSIVGSTVGSAGRNLVSAGKKFNGAKGGKAKVAALASGALSVGAGGFSGAVRGFNRGRGAKNFADMRKAASGAVEAATAAKDTRDKKWASYKAANPKTNAFNTFFGVLSGNVMDKAEQVGEYFGYNNVNDLVEENKLIDDIKGKKKAVATAVESVIDGEAAKSSSSFRVGTYSATELRQKYLAIQDARAGILKDANGELISAAQAQQDYDEYRYKFSQAAQNVAFLTSSHFENLSNGTDDERDMYVKLSEANAKAEDFRVVVGKNLGRSYIEESGFTYDNLHEDLKVDLEGSAMKMIGDKLDIAKAQNSREIANRLNESKSNDSNN